VYKIFSEEKAKHAFGEKRPRVGQGEKGRGGGGAVGKGKEKKKKKQSKNAHEAQNVNPVKEQVTSGGCQKNIQPLETQRKKKEGAKKAKKEKNIVKSKNRWNQKR